MASSCGLALPSACRPAAMAAPPVLGSALPPPVVLGGSSFWALTGRIVEDRKYLEGRLREKESETRGWRTTRWPASGHGEKIVLLQHLRYVATGRNNIPQFLRHRGIGEHGV